MGVGADKVRRALLLTHHFGVSSLQSAYRDAVNIRRFEVTVVCYWWIDRETFPFPRVRELGSRWLPLRALNASLRRSAVIQEWDAVEYGPRLARLLRNLRPEVVCAEFGWSAARLVRELAASGLPLVVRYRGSDITAAARNRKYWARLPRLFSLAAASVFNSDFLRSKALALGCPGDKAVVVHPGVEMPPEPQREAKSPGQPFVLACVARLSLVKGHRYLLEAARKVLDQSVPLELLLVGGGELEAEIRSQVKQMALSGQVRFCGPMPPAGVRAILQRANALVLPSVRCPDGQEESFGIALIEGSSMGLPVIGTRVGGIPEAVRDGETGFLVPERDASALAEAIARLAADPLRARDMGARGRLMVARDFEIGKAAARLDEVLAAAADRAPAAGGAAE